MLLSIDAKSQNLVKNHSFENAWSCPEDYNGYAVKFPFPDWINPNNGTPDLMHSCSALRAGVPENFAGYMYPYDGGAYAGIILREMFDDSLRVYKGVSREYLQTKLTEPLKKNTLYCVKFYYVNAKKSMYSVDALGITLTVEQIKAKNADRILQRPQITNRPGHIMDNMDEWTEFCGYYRARGGEHYLTIGNFWDNSTTQYVTNKNEYSDSAFFYAYYLIDNVTTLLGVPTGNRTHSTRQQVTILGKSTTTTLPIMEMTVLTATAKIVKATAMAIQTETDWTIIAKTIRRPTLTKPTQQA